MYLILYKQGESWVVATVVHPGDSCTFVVNNAIRYLGYRQRNGSALMNLYLHNGQ